MANVEYRALLQCVHGLTNLLQHNLSVSDKLLEKGWVTRDIHGWALTARGVSDREKASRLVSCLADRVKDAAQVFHDFFDVLKEDPFFADILEKLNAEYKTLLEIEKPCNNGKDEKVNVVETIAKLEKQFSSMQRRLQSEMKTNSELSPEILVDSLTLLPISLRAEYQKFVLENLKTLEKAESIREIFHHLNIHCFTFTDYQLLEFLVDEYGSRRLKQDMLMYTRKMGVFMDETTVQQLMDHWPGRRDIPPHFEELRAVIGEDPGTFTLRRLNNLRKGFCSKIRLFETVFILKRFARKNSFVVCWVVSSIFVPQLKSAISSLRSFYQREHIISVTVGTQRLYSIAAEYGERLLFLCSSVTGDLREFQDLLSQPGMETNIYDEGGHTPLWYLSYYGRTELVQLLLQHGAQVGLPNDNEYGDTALLIACAEGHVMVAAVLIKKGALVNYLNKKGQHPLHAASFYGRLECVELLLNHNAQIDLPVDDDLGSTALGAASQEGHVVVTRLLIERGAAIDYQNKAGASPLDMACQKGHDDVAQLLLDGGARIDLPTKNEYGDTALLIACAEGHVMVAAVLIKKGALVNYLNKKGQHPLHAASFYGRLECVELLLNHNAQIDLPVDDDLGSTALGAASQEGHVVVTRLLIEKGAAIDYQNKAGASPLVMACEKGHDDVVKLLLDSGARIDLPTKDVTSLLVACQNGHAKVVKTLINRGACVDYQSETSGWTAIYFAIQNNDLAMIEMLIKEGARLDIKDNNGLTAFEVAKAHDQQAVCDLLEKYGGKTTEMEITQEQREQVKRSSERLKRVLDFLERTLLRGRAKKKEQQLIDPDRPETPSNIFQRRRENSKQLAKQNLMEELAMHIH